MDHDSILKINDLKTYFKIDDQKVVKAVDGVSFEVPKGKTLGIVGESGSGKSITALSILQLLDEPGEIVGGEILFNGDNLIEKSIPEMRKIRGNQISMIFQEPMTSLNPVHTIGNQISETIDIHQKLSRTESKKKTIELLELVGIPSPEKRIKQYPLNYLEG